MSQPLPYDEFKFDKNIKLVDVFNTSDDSDINYFLEGDMSYPDIIKEENKKFPFAPENGKNFFHILNHLKMKTNQIIVHKQKS